jgi:hypothetical protein
MSRQLEQKLQEQYTFYLYSRGVLFCASAGGMHTPNKMAAIRMKRAGYKAGHPDVVIYEPRGGWHGMTVELKVKNYAEKTQRDWRDELLKRGYYAVIVPGRFGFYEARSFLEEQTGKYLKGEIELKEAQQ